VRRIWTTGTQDSGTDGAGRLCLLQAHQLSNPRGLPHRTRGVSRLGLWHREPRIPPTVLAPYAPMKHIVFGNGRFMALVCSRPLRGGRLENLHVLLPRQDLIRPTITTRLPPRWSRPIASSLGALDLLLTPHSLSSESSFTCFGPPPPPPPPPPRPPHLPPLPPLLLFSHETRANDK
jgi:hypothetical protein